MPSASSDNFFRLLFTCINIRAMMARIREMTPKMMALELSDFGSSPGPSGPFGCGGVHSLTYLMTASNSGSVMEPSNTCRYRFSPVFDPQFQIIYIPIPFIQDMTQIRPCGILAHNMATCTLTFKNCRTVLRYYLCNGKNNKGEYKQ
jgi:hypothetical protein